MEQPPIISQVQTQPSRSGQQTGVIAIIIGILLLVTGGWRSLLLLCPGTAGWILTIFAGNSASNRDMHVVAGVVAALMMMAQFALLSVVLITFEMYSDRPDVKSTGAGLITVVAVFVFYVASLVSYFGRIVKTRSNNSLQPTATAPPVLTKT